MRVWIFSLALLVACTFSTLCLFTIHHTANDAHDLEYPIPYNCVLFLVELNTIILTY